MKIKRVETIKRKKCTENRETRENLAGNTRAISKEMKTKNWKKWEKVGKRMWRLNG